MARVLVIFGGRSAEHEISCISAVAILDALVGGGHDVIAVGIDRAGGWHLAQPTGDTLAAEGPPVSFAIPEGTISGPDGSFSFDVVFPVLHGPFGEDGTLQGMLDMAGVPYVGCGVLASAAAMHKGTAKQLFSAAGLISAPYRVVATAAEAAAAAEELGYPVFVKPVAMGSSLGVSAVEAPAQLGPAVSVALELSPELIIEERVLGREIEVAVLDGPRTSVPGEIVIKGDWYDYHAKYSDATSEFVAPADLSADETAAVRDMAATAFAALRCRGLARVDFLFEEDGRGFLINEANTMPGFTPISGFPKMWMASGMTYPELCNELVDLALA